jgi:hypothetical protein
VHRCLHVSDCCCCQSSCDAVTVLSAHWTLRWRLRARRVRQLRRPFIVLGTHDAPLMCHPNRTLLGRRLEGAVDWRAAAWGPTGRKRSKRRRGHRMFLLHPTAWRYRARTAAACGSTEAVRLCHCPGVLAVLREGASQFPSRPKEA